MLESQIPINLIHKETITRSDGFKLSHKCYRERICAKWIVVHLTFALLLCVPIAAEAEMVYGHVYCEGCNLPKQITFTLTNEESRESFRIATDKYTNYSFFLPPGTYKVKLLHDGNTYRTKIRSYPNPIRQDIYLQEER